jgi:uncharacterized protein (DUF1810 family)
MLHPEYHCAVLNFPNSSDTNGELYDEEYKQKLTQENELSRVIVDLEQSLPSNDDDEFMDFDKTFIKYNDDLSLYRYDMVQSNGTYDLIDKSIRPKRIPVSVISAYPPNMRNQRYVNMFETYQFKNIEKKIKNQLKTVCILPILYEKEQDPVRLKKVNILILGAFGCGDFSPPYYKQYYTKYNKIIAEIYVKILKEIPNIMSYYNYICFAIPQGVNFKAFKNVFEKENVNAKVIESVKPTISNSTYHSKYDNDKYGWKSIYGSSFYSGEYSSYKPLGERKENDFTKFIEQNKEDYLKAVDEVTNGLKISHWMWYIFPQLKGLGYSDNSSYYGIKSFAEAKEYLKNTELLNYLVKITKIVQTQLKTATVTKIFGCIDNEKFLSCMTLFYHAIKELDPQDFQPYALTIPEAAAQNEIIEMFKNCMEITEKELHKKDKKTLKECGVEIIDSPIKYSHQSYSSYQPYQLYSPYQSYN